GYAITAWFIYIISSKIQFESVKETLASANLALWLGLGLPCMFIAYVLRITCWWLMLRALNVGTRWSHTAGPFMASIALNNLLPFRAGDAVRAFAFSNQLGTRSSQVLGTILIQRLQDTLTLLLLLAIGLKASAIINIPHDLTANIYIISILALSATAGIILLAKPAASCIGYLKKRFARFESPLEKLGAFVDSLKILRNIKVLLPLSILGILSWSAEGGIYWASAEALGIEIPWSIALVSLALSTLSTLIPSSPGYVGTFHFFCSLSLELTGVDATSALAYAVLVHALLWAASTLVGLFYWNKSSRLERSLASATES
ncbi:MAG: hypothetical protein B7X06_01215, partial [Verrucomicrobia bacterium 21-51-4]